MQKRPPALQEFLDSVHAALRYSRTDDETARCVRQTFALLGEVVETSGKGGRRLPACTSLPEAVRTASAARPDIARVARAFEALEPSLAWSQRNGGPFASENFMEGHANVMVIGPGGLEDRDDAWVGVSLLAPNVRYPDHQHRPEEVYLVLSLGEFRQADGPWFEPGIGGTVFNEPNIVHAMRSGSVPLFAVWCLHPDKNKAT
jgi:hypothetical protein